MAKSRTATSGRPSSVWSGVSSRSMPASAPQAITDVAKPVMVCAAMSAHFCVGAVMMMRVPTMGKASANVSMISTPLIFSFDMTPVRGRATWPRAEARSARRPCPPSSTPPWGRTIKQVPLPAQAREYARPSRVSNRLPRRALLLRLVVLDIGEAHVVGWACLPAGRPQAPGCQCTTSSIFLASAKSLSVMPLAAWFISLTSTQA